MNDSPALSSNPTEILDAEGSRARKRKRLDVSEISAGSGAVVPSCRCQALWFPDGSIILATKGLSFKVHYSVLGIRSEVLSKLCEQCTQDPSSSFEGCPVISVDDNDSDMENMLSIVYGIDRYVFKL